MVFLAWRSRTEAGERQDWPFLTHMRVSRPEGKLALITMEVERHGGTVLLGITGEIDAASAPLLRRALDEVTRDEGVIMIDVHGVGFMDSAGLLHFLDLHRQAEDRGLRVLVIGWQRQPQQVMARAAGMRAAGASAGERSPLAGFRRLIEDRARREADLAELGDAFLR
ncbi:STAS domain-containing protein [Streptomyces sp. NBC_00328]|uniref:STAS domain-containing protein n=1 Tax=Streptomyces sp. NBC_00328 TaxID=2903646 RepID=UPI002E2C58ED|nr:STAS domain-containing protein [Streptomyces sp. NBC_00328]